jgi:hypothetical protein
MFFPSFPTKFICLYRYIGLLATTNMAKQRKINTLILNGFLFRHLLGFLTSFIQTNDFLDRFFFFSSHLLVSDKGNTAYKTR